MIRLIAAPHAEGVAHKRILAAAERQHLLDLTGIAPGEYAPPHSRQTALDGHETVHI